jgi:two-component system, sensor histidine kinase and response regulator
MDEVFTPSDLTTASKISVYQLVNALFDAAFICDQTGRVLVCSEQVLPFFEIYDKAKVINSSFQSYLAYEHIDEAYSLFLITASDANSRNSGRFMVKRGLKETVSADISFASISSSDHSNKHILVTFREAPQPDPGVGLLQKKDVRLSRLCDTLVNHTGHSDDRTKKLLSQIGETLGATTCNYSKIENGDVQSNISWESPFNKGISPQLGNKQFLDYLNDQKKKLGLIRKPLLSAFLDAESTYNEEYGVKAILGFTIFNNNTISGILTAVFTFNYSLSDVDEQFLQTISAILNNEGSSENNAKQTTEVSFRQLIDCFSDPVYVLSAEGIIMEVNKGAYTYYGYEREELIGQTPILLSAEGRNDNELIQQMLIKAFEGEPQKFEWWGKRKNGEIFPKEVLFNKSNYYGHDVVIAIGRDLTESKKVEKELLRYNLELKESNVSKDKFFGILAHDLKNPFQGLLGFLDLLYEDLDELSNAQIKEYLSNVRNASYQTYALLENLLEWSRIQSGKMPFTPSVFSIREEISSVISILDNNASQKEIKLFNEVDQEIKVEADRNMIHSVLQNLITNSIKFSNSKGKVVIRSRVPQTFSKTKSTTDPGDRQWLEISISDNGIGIPEEILPKLFKLNGQYSQAGTANEPGTGLGLVLCHEMVEKNGGRIWAESIPGQGTTFIFTLPLSN